MNDPTPTPEPSAVAPDELAGLAVAGAEQDAAAAPPGQEPSPADDELSTSEIIRMVADPWYDMLAPNWKISDSERQNLADVYGELLDKYFPDFKATMGPEIKCIVITGAIFGPRIALKKPPRLPEKKPDDAEVSGPQS